MPRGVKIVRKFILRTMHYGRDGQFLVDNWYVEDDIEALAKKAHAVDADRWQAYESRDITDDVKILIQAIDEQTQELEELKEKEERRRMYEVLKEEFESD